MNGENGPHVALEPIESDEKQPVEVQDLRIITHYSGGIYGLYLKWKTMPTTSDYNRKSCPGFLKAALSTKSILRASQLQDPKSNVNVHFHLVNEEFIGITFLK